MNFLYDGAFNISKDEEVKILKLKFCLISHANFGNKGINPNITKPFLQKHIIILLNVRPAPLIYGRKIELSRYSLRKVS